VAKRHLTPDDEMGRLLEHRLQQAEVHTEGVCADAETLASYVDDGMSAAERADWEAHFATCAKCRRSLALMARLKETSSPEWEGETGRGQSTPGGNLWVWMPLVACILVAAGLWFATRPAERAMPANGTAAGSAVTQEARTEPASPPPPAAVAPAPSATPAAPSPARPAAEAKALPRGQGQLKEIDGLDYAFRNKRDAEKAAGTARANAALQSQAHSETKDKVVAREIAKPVERFATEDSLREQVQQQKPGQKSQIVSGPREQQQAVGGLAAGGAAPAGAAGNVSPANSANGTNVANAANAANAQPSGPMNSVPPPASAPVNVAPAQAPPPPQAQTAAAARGRGEQDYAAAKGALFKSADAKLEAERQGLLGKVADPFQPARQWRIFRFGHIEVTRDNGGSWSSEVMQSDTAYLAMSSPQPGVGWIVGSKGTVWRLGIGPETRTAVGDEENERRSSVTGAWQARSVPTQEDLVSVTATSAQEAVVVTRSGQRFATSDGGRSWTRR
jgi:hypothetical protein